MKKILLLSGGLDSTALAFWIRPDVALTIDYGQAACDAEKDAARVISEELRIDHDVIRVDCAELGMGDMVRSHSTRLEPAISTNPGPDWWPFRNQLLITLAAARSLIWGTSEIYTGTVKTDRRFKDGTPEFYQIMDQLICMQEGNLRLRAPAIDMDSVELLRVSGIPLSLAAWSHSCHRANIACGECRGCEKRRQVMYEQWGCQ